MLENLKNKKVIIIIAIGVILLFTKKIIDSTNNYNEISTEENISTEATQEKNDDEQDKIVIHVIGAIKKPGVVKVQEGSRIEDVIEVAGGLTEDADITNVNLAYILEDGVKLRIPSVNDEEISQEEYISDESGEGIILSENTSKNSGGLVNINTATQSELETLNGIGPAIAEKIIEYREKNGKFKSIEDIKNVGGIGKNKYENIKDYIKV